MKANPLWLRLLAVRVLSCLLALAVQPAWAAMGWVPVSTGLGNLSVNVLAIHPTAPATVYAGTADGIFKTTNGGASWTVASAGLLGGFANVVTLAVDPQNSSIVYAGTASGSSTGAYKSTNGGANWSQINSGYSGTRVLSIALVPATPTTLYMGTDLGVFKSTNGGAAWTSVMAATNVFAVAVNPATPTTVYAAAYAGNLFKSTDGGASWAVIGSGMGSASQYVFSLAIDPDAPTTIYAGTQTGGAFKSTDGGANWAAINSGLGTSYVTVMAVNPLDTATLYAGTYPGAGAYKSSNGGASWSSVSGGLTHYVSALATTGAVPLTIYAGTAGGGVFKSATEPAAPTGVVAVPGDTQATVSWTAPSHGGSPIIGYTATAVEDGTRQCTPSPATATTCTVTGLSNGTAYTFTVTATNGVGASGASVASVPVMPAGVPAGITGVTAMPGIPGSGQITLSWTVPADNGRVITSYLVNGSLTCTAMPCTLTGLANAAQHTFTVQATNDVGTGLASAASAAVWLQDAQTINFPVQPGQTYVSGGTFAINPASATSTLAVVYGSPTPGMCTVSGATVAMVGAGTCILTANQAGNDAWAAASQQTQNIAISPGVNTITFPPQAGQTFATGGTFAISPVATGLSNAAVAYGSQTPGVCSVSGTTVTIISAGTCTIAANQAGDANWAAAAQVTQDVQIAPVAPGAPTDANATPGNAQATVGWTAPVATGGGITQYSVTAPGTTGCTATPPATSCTVPGLANGATYTFSVQAENGAGASAPAVALPVTPLANSKAFSAPSPTGSGAVGVAVSGGGATCAFERVQLLQASSASTAPPVALSLPHGLLDFVLNGCDTTDVTVNITYPDPLPQGVLYWKLAGGTWAPYAGAVAVAGATMATLTLRDGGQGDDDGTPNGRIVDPGQVGVMAAPPGLGGAGAAAIPTLSGMALAALATLMALMGAARVQRRRCS